MQPIPKVHQPNPQHALALALTARSNPQTNALVDTRSFAFALHAIASVMTTHPNIIAFLESRGFTLPTSFESPQLRIEMLQIIRTLIAPIKSFSPPITPHHPEINYSLKDGIGTLRITSLNSLLLPPLSQDQLTQRHPKSEDFIRPYQEVIIDAEPLLNLPPMEFPQRVEVLTIKKAKKLSPGLRPFFNSINLHRGPIHILLEDFNYTSLIVFLHELTKFVRDHNEPENLKQLSLDIAAGPAEKSSSPLLLKTGHFDKGKSLKKIKHLVDKVAWKIGDIRIFQRLSETQKLINDLEVNDIAIQEIKDFANGALAYSYHRPFLLIFEPE